MTFFELLATSTPLLVVSSLVLGLLVGSFLNVVVYRVPIMLYREWTAQCQEMLELEDVKPSGADQAAGFQVFNLMKPDSHCPACQHKITALENIPVVSYLLLRGKCSQCKSSISLRYPSVEFVTGLMTALVGWTFGVTWLTVALLFFTWYLIALTLIDYDEQLLPDNLTLPLLWGGLLVQTIDLGMGISLRDAVIGAMAGYFSLWSFYWCFKLLTGKEGMGYGDFKLLAALGAWLGWQSLLPIVILSSVVGAGFGILNVLILRRDKTAPMPFGPFLAGAGFIMLIWGPQITDLYRQTFLL
ncbi:MAG: A24 family peptidase [Gammaproteobacteria bacterium]|nr:prepilin peptidase [Pseudomonadales bacterium]MCP5345578.1 prepilin peptidase [Pseudomonadales bacterium]